MSDTEIQESINKYLEARKSILAIGKKYPERIGGNDNIIGRIGEFIALLFLESIGQNPRMVESSSNPGYDFIQGERKTQVKVITSENQRGVGNPLKEGWTQFILIELGDNYIHENIPEKIGLITEAQHKEALDEDKELKPVPTVKLTMLGPDGLFGRYGKVYDKNEISIMDSFQKIGKMGTGI